MRPAPHLCPPPTLPTATHPPHLQAVVAQEFHLPPRSLHPVWLAFQPGEHAFYQQARPAFWRATGWWDAGAAGRRWATVGSVLQAALGAPCRPCRPHLPANSTPWGPAQVVERARQSREELASFRQQQEDGGSDDGGGTPAARRSRKRAAAKRGERLELAAAENLTQLRLACIHPQVRAGRRCGAGGGGAWLGLPLHVQRCAPAGRAGLQVSGTCLPPAHPSRCS